MKEFTNVYVQEVDKDKNIFYHGTELEGIKKFNQAINWFTKDYEYAKYYALALKDVGYVYNCNILINKILNIGNSGARVFNLLPVTEPYKLSEESHKLFKFLKLSEEEINTLLDDVYNEYPMYQDSKEKYRMRLSTIVRTLVFKNIVKDKGYDCISCIEYNPKLNVYVKTYGVLNSDSIKILNVDKVNTVNENLDEKIEKHEELNPRLFKDNKLQDEVKEKLLDIVDVFVDELKESEIDIDIKDVVLVGSNVNYNYTEDSDIDLHIIVDTSKLNNKELYSKVYDAYKRIFNKNYTILIRDIPVELYVELDEPKGVSGGMYSLNNGWLKEPVQKDIPDIDMEEFEKLFSKWEDRYFRLMRKYEHPLDEKLNSISVRAIQKLIDDIYDLRQESIKKDGEFGLGNLVFKEFRNLGYLDELKVLLQKETANELSLYESIK